MIMRKILLIPIGLALSIAGCAGIGPNATYHLGTTSANYNPLYHTYLVNLNGSEIGTSVGSMTTSSVKTGSQILTWKDANTGELHRSKNDVVLTRNHLKNKKYLVVHIYPDDTIEIITSMNWPEETEKGIKWREKIRNQNK